MGRGLRKGGARSRRKPRNRLRADIVAAAYRAESFAVHVAPPDCLALLVRGEFRLTPEFDALRFRVGPAPCRAFLDAAMLKLRSDAKDGKTISAKSEVVSRNGSASDRMPAPARCISRAITRRSVVSRDKRSTAGMITTVAMREDGDQLFKLWAVGGRARDLLAEYLLATGGLQLGRRAGEFLRLRRDAGIAVNHAPILEQNLGTEKRNVVSTLGLFQIS